AGRTPALRRPHRTLLRLAAPPLAAGRLLADRAVHVALALLRREAAADLAAAGTALGRRTAHRAAGVAGVGRAALVAEVLLLERAGQTRVRVVAGRFAVVHARVERPAARVLVALGGLLGRARGDDLVVFLPRI